MAEQHPLRCHVGEQELGLEKGPGYGAWSSRNGEVLEGWMTLCDNREAKRSGKKKAASIIEHLLYEEL